MKDLIACYISDNYLYGVSDSELADSDRYWLSLEGEDMYCRVRLEDVPDDIAQRLLDYSAGNCGAEPFSDGYDAATAAAPYVKTVLYCSVEWGEPTECWLCGQIHS